MVGRTINWPDEPVPVFDSSWEMLAPKPMNDVEQTMFEISVEENLR